MWLPAADIDDHVSAPLAPLRGERTPTRACDGIPIAGLTVVTIASFGFVMLLLFQAGLTVRLDPRLLGFLILYAATACSIIGLSRNATSAVARAWADGAAYLTLFAGVCVFGVLASYPIAAGSHGFADASVERFDHFVRFDWLSWYELMVRHPQLQPLERAAYENIFFTPGVILVYLAATARRAEATRFITAFWLAAMMCLVAFHFVPTEGPLALMVHGHVPYLPVSALYQAQMIPELRAHQLHQIDLADLRGLVGAPSFHAASATLFLCAAWATRALRWPLVALNVAMLLATPVEGTHYLGDILAGMLVALVALAGTIMFEAWLVRGRPSWRDGLPVRAVRP